MNTVICLDHAFVLWEPLFECLFLFLFVRTIMFLISWATLWVGAVCEVGWGGLIHHQNTSAHCGLKEEVAAIAISTVLKALRYGAYLGVPGAPGAPRVMPVAMKKRKPSTNPQVTCNPKSKARRISVPPPLQKTKASLDLQEDEPDDSKQKETFDPESNPFKRKKETEPETSPTELAEGVAEDDGGEKRRRRR